MIVMGLDGSLQNFGIAIAKIDPVKLRIIDILELKLSKTHKNSAIKRADDDMERFKQHWREILAIGEKYDPQMVFGEIPSGSKDVRAAFAFGGVTAMLACIATEIDVVTVTPMQVKVASTGVKHADKEDIIEAMYHCFPNAEWLVSKKPNAMNIKTPEGLFLMNANEHLADAIGVIKAGLDKVRADT
jgi:Holliday junction resolvasome RuvABC endonuclease subunit